MIGNRHKGQGAHEVEHFSAPREIAARKLADHERVSPNCAVFEQLRESGVPLAQVVDPDGGIDQQRSARGRGASAWNELRRSIRAAERGQTSGALPRDERVEPGVHDGGLLANSAQVLCALEQSVVDDQCSPHVHQYG